MHDFSDTTKNIIPASQIASAQGPTALMRERTSTMYDMTPLHVPQAIDLYKSSNWFVDRFLFIQTENGPVAISRSKAQSENGANLVFLHRYFGGGVRGVMGDLNIDRNPGEMYLIDQSRRVNCIQFQTCVQGVYIPKHLIGYDPNIHPPFMRFSNNKTLSALLYRNFDQVFADIKDHNLVDQMALDRLIACVRYALGTDDQDGDVRRQARNAMTDLIRVHIERNLCHPDLSATSLLKSFGLSRASLFRMFEAEGGVRRFINRRRLYRAVLEIADSAGTRGAVSAAADRWGFSSSANFNRAVREQFDVSPGMLVQLPQRDLRYLGVAKQVDEFAQRA